jgi:serine/threonine protein kinase
MSGTPNYMAPEMLKSVGDGSYSHNVDIWSLGITVLEMLTAERPFDELTNQFAIMFAIAKLDAPPPDSRVFFGGYTGVHHAVFADGPLRAPGS